jgi:hypothetical protein
MTVTLRTEAFTFLVTPHGSKVNAQPVRFKVLGSRLWIFFGMSSFAGDVACDAPPKLPPASALISSLA